MTSVSSLWSALMFIGHKEDVDDNSPTMMEAVDVYFRPKADKQTPTFIRAAKRL